MTNTPNRNQYEPYKSIKELKINPAPGQKPADVDCQKSAVSGGSGGSDSCGTTFAGHSCKDVSSQCPGGDAACIEGLGCKRGYCSGGATNVCCP